jgi:DNA-binding transcriptional MocR family regulator
LHAWSAVTLDLSFNYPSAPGQTELLRAALRQLAAAGDLESLLRYQPHGGREHERATAARHLANRGVTATAGTTLLVSGAQHGLTTAAMALLEPGDVVAVDALTYPGFKLAAEAARLELAPIPAAGRGPDLDSLTALCKRRRVRAVYAMPTLHNPLGWVMSASRRRELVSIARRHGLILIEDAAYAYLAENAPPTLASLAPERTIHVTSLSKSVATGLRVGFVCAPRDWIPKLERVIRATTWNTPATMTAIACNWINDGTVARLEDEKRQDATLRQILAAEALGKLKTMSHPASYFIWVPLTQEIRADAVAMALMRERISVSTALPFATSTHVPHAIRLAIGSVDLPTLRRSLETVARVITEQSY